MSGRRFAKAGTTECPDCGADESHYPECPRFETPAAEYARRTREDLAKWERDGGWDRLAREGGIRDA